MKKYGYLYFLLLLVIAACSNSGTNIESNDKVIINEPAYDSVAEKRRNDSIAYEEKRKQLPKEKPVARNWERMLKEYHVILCRVTKGTANKREQERYEIIKTDLAKVSSELTGKEKIEFMAEHVRASDTNNCR